MNILLVTADNGRVKWPFPYVNGQQTPESLALQSDKQAHKHTKQPIDLNQFKEALI